MGRPSAAVALLAAAAVAAGAPALARGSTAPPVQWCGSTPSATDRPDIVTGRQVHVIYAYPSDGVDRFALFSSAIATDLAAVDTWWRQQDYTRAPRFDLADLGCPGTMGSLDISDVKLPLPTAHYYDGPSRLEVVSADLVAAGFTNNSKKYLVYFDTPQPLDPGICGEGFNDETLTGGAFGYAGVWIAPNLESTEFASGCGMMEDPGSRGGYSAITAAHELIHTFGGLDTWDSPGPPHACPGSPSHACDNPLDIMEPGGSTYWLDNTLLDSGHDDYYAHSGTWWDVQDSPWLRHLSDPTYTLTVQDGAGVASIASDVPGVACEPGPACVSTWDSGSAVVLTGTATAGYSRPIWGGACASAGVSPTCQITLGADTTATLSYAKMLTGGALSASYLRHPARVRASMSLSRAPLAAEAALTCHGAAGLKLLTHHIVGATALCIWFVPKRLAGRRLTGRVSVGLDDARVLARSFSLRLPKRL